MSTAEKIVVRLSITLFCLFFLFMVVMIPFNLWLNPEPDRVLSRMERRDPEEAQKIIDNYAVELKMIAAAADDMEENNLYFYTLNRSASENKEALDGMSQEVVDALRHLEQEFRGCNESLYLHRGQIGILMTDDGGGFSLLCYPGGDLFFDRNEKSIRCLDMGDGWELQMYYMPKG